jgi:HAD superfamily hydrolase (TIGR01450 family)
VSKDPWADRVLQRARGRAVCRRRVAGQTQNTLGLSRLRSASFLFDVDGTLVLSEDPNTGAGGARALPGAVDVLALLRARGTRYACFTNGTGQTPGAIAAKLRGLGLDVQDSEMLTPASVAAEYLASTYPGELVLAFGTDGLFEPLASAGVRLAPLDQAHDARAVLVGADPDFTYAKLTAACRAVWAGAPMLVTSMAPYFASSGGRLPSTSGAIAAGIRHVTGAEPVVVGKPSPLVIEMAARVLQCDVAQVAVVGDDVRLEIRMAREAGATGVLVLSGTSHESDIAEVSPDAQPDLVVSVVGDLLDHLH